MLFDDSFGCCSEQNKIKVWNDGMGIPVVKHQLEKMFVPTLIFGTLLTSSNFDDTQKKVTGKMQTVRRPVFQFTDVLCLLQVVVTVLEQNCATSSAPNLLFRPHLAHPNAPSSSHGRTI